MRRFKRLTIQADAWGYIQGHGLVLPLIGLDSPKSLPPKPRTERRISAFRPAAAVAADRLKIGDLRITDGDAHVVIPKLKADFNAQIATQGEGHDAQIVVDAKGTYAAQPITGQLVGGALLSLRDADHPWPVDLTLANGPTHVALNGTLQDPLAFKGADVRLQFNGPDMGLLEPLVGFPIPKTPPYQIAGKLDLDGFDKIRFDDFQGRLGNSDIAGTIEDATERNGSEGQDEAGGDDGSALEPGRPGGPERLHRRHAGPDETPSATPQQRAAAGEGECQPQAAAGYADQRAAA